MRDHVTDYLIVGAGASGLAFADTLLDVTDATITLVDRRDAPGGHWNDAYPFVRLHQPSSYYGVASRELSQFTRDTAGWNAGYEELASGPQVLAYFHDVMERRLLPSGRVRFLPMCAYENGVLTHELSGETAGIEVRRKVVDARLQENGIPLTHRRKFEVAARVACIPPNFLPRRAARHAGFTVLGGGKTAMDSVLWLLARGADPDRIRWVVPRDPWLVNRASTQPDSAFFFENIGGFAIQTEAMGAATSWDDLALRLEEAGLWLRLSDEVMPRMIHGAVLSRGEIEALRTVRDIVRLGHVQAIEPDRVALTRGSLPADPETLYIDCTASALKPLARRPVFADDRITLQMVRLFQPTFSTAITARIEALPLGTDQKNELARPIPMPDSVADWALCQAETLMNNFAWTQVDDLRAWLRTCRLDAFRRSRDGIDRDDPKVRAVYDTIKAHGPRAVANVRRLSAA